MTNEAIGPKKKKKKNPAAKTRSTQMISRNFGFNPLTKS